jgi:hypothetical protein
MCAELSLLAERFINPAKATLQPPL